MMYIESNLQRNCVMWFRLQFPYLAPLLFAVPNGGYRNKITARRLKEEGVVAGVADCLLLIPNKQFHALCIEFKTEKGKQSECQKNWQQIVQNYGYKYIICRNIENFIFEIKKYLLTAKPFDKFAQI